MQPDATFIRENNKKKKQILQDKTLPNETNSNYSSD